MQSTGRAIVSAFVTVMVMRMILMKKKKEVVYYVAVFNEILSGSLGQDHLLADAPRY